MRSRVTGRVRRGSAPHVRRGSARRRCALTAAGSAAVIAVFVAAASAQRGGDARVLKDLRQLVAAPGGPPGGIVTLFRGGRTTVLTAGGRQGSVRAGRRAPPTTCASPASPRRSAARSRCTSCRSGSWASTTRSAGASWTLPAAWARGHDPRAAQPHQRRSRLHRVRRLSPAGRHRSARATCSPRRIIGWVRARPAALHAGIAVRVLEHRQHRRRTDRRAVTGSVLRSACSRRVVFGPPG